MNRINELTENELQYVISHSDELEDLIEQLCLIPAPSHHEEKRAEFCRKWLIDNGCNATIDNALNVICTVGDIRENDIILFTAHTDTVFPDLDPLPFSKDDDRIYSPSAGDDTACVAIMLLVARYVITNKLKPKCCIMFVANSCEEGLGNLKGIREIMNCYGSRVKEMYSFDSTYHFLVNRCVGSHRYSIEVKTKGGHSFSGFGNPNAIHIASQLINRLYAITVPNKANSRTTYNVGTIEGGTSINTIAQSCSFRYEYRSDDVECLAYMKKEFEAALNDFSEYDITLELLGERPCMKDVDMNRLSEMTEMCKAIQEKYSGTACTAVSGSTDCNIPMSMGIPALTAGVFDGAGEHTREEYVIRDSLPKGFRIAMELILSCV